IGTVGLLLSIFSYEIIHLMATDKFFVAAQYIPLVVSSMIIFGLKYHFEIGILIHKKTKYIPYISGVSAFLNIILNYFLIQKYSLWGALIASNISIFVTTALNYIFSQKLYYINFEMMKVYKMFLLICIFYFISIFLNFSNFMLSISAKIGLVTLYVGAIIALNFIGKEVLSLIKERIIGYYEKISINTGK
ncbi:MAG: polysaccharide biosynthesis C-terminal domain-containing protein, partial [Bacteroidales bacterium]|nr:polysaccharide biosynthesis C-terminal domain-containing protein [Bacteroidales bacterium]